MLGLVEDRFLHTRIGDGSLIQVPARGAIAAAFDHFDTRAGDPNLHTHLVIANKVQGPDGALACRRRPGALRRRAWRAARSTTPRLPTCLPPGCPSASATATADPGGPRRTRSTESPTQLLAAFSSRSQAITAHVQDLVAGFTDAHGRDPDRVEILRLRQQATLATRPDKHVAPLAELRARWRATAETVTGQPVERSPATR